MTPGLYNAYTKEPLNLPGNHWAPGSWVRANPRSKLRTHLSTGINIQWGKRFERYSVENGKVTVYFYDGSTTTGDILVGADGSRSIGMSLLINFLILSYIYLFTS